MAPCQLDTIASQVAAVAAAKRLVMALVLLGVVCEVTDQTVDDLQRQVQSLFPQLVWLPGNCRGGQGEGR